MSPHRIRVKICGITRKEDALAAIASGADALGLVFYAKSPRAVDPAQAAEICRCIPPFVTTVGLFVNAGVEVVEDVLQQVPLKLLQFHGDENDRYCGSFGRPFIKALHINDAVVEADQAGEVHRDVHHRMALYPNASGFLFDTHVANVPGGTGKAFDWTLLPPDADRPVILAGGLHADNVATAIAISQPYAVDVSSGVESSPGIKDEAKIGQFMRQVQLAGQE